MSLTAEDILPSDHERACLVGRVWIDGEHPGPRTCHVRNGVLHDLSSLAPTMSDLCAMPDAADAVRGAADTPLIDLETALAEGRLLAPPDLQAVKAAGVTFIRSLIERVIEEAARGDAGAGQGLRGDITNRLENLLRNVSPGSAQAGRAKEVLQSEGLWSQYLEVAIGPDPEIFTKAQPLSSVGHCSLIGVRPDSSWNNPEPEMVLVVSPAGECVGATLGNDVNLRDFEGRSALLLGTAKDNTASSAIGPFIRLLDDAFSLADVERAKIRLQVDGEDGFRSDQTGSLADIARPPLDLVRAATAQHHYPDGFVLFLGAALVPAGDRLGEGHGFTHAEADVVTISSPRLGTLLNTVTTCERAPAWTFGLRALSRNLAARGLI